MIFNQHNERNNMTLAETEELEAMTESRDDWKKRAEVAQREARELRALLITACRNGETTLEWMKFKSFDPDIVREDIAQIRCAAGIPANDQDHGHLPAKKGAE